MSHAENLSLAAGEVRCTAGSVRACRILARRSPTARKAGLRDQVLAARRELAETERAAAGRLLRDAVLEMPQTQMAGIVAAYVSVGSEPGTRGPDLCPVETGHLRAAPAPAAGRRPGLGLLRGPGLAGPGPARAAAARRAAPRRHRDHQRRPDHRPGPGRRPAAGTGWAAAAAPTTGRWPGSARPSSAWPCCMTGSCWTRSRPGRRISRSGRWPGPVKESPACRSRCYHLAVDRGEC